MRISVKAIRRGFHGGIRRYPEGHPEATGTYALAAGKPFDVDESVFMFDDAGRLKVNAKHQPLLPSWMEPVGPVPVIDPKQIECVVVAEKDIKARKDKIRAVTRALATPDKEGQPSDVEAIRKLGEARRARAEAAKEA